MFPEIACSPNGLPVKCRMKCFQNCQGANIDTRRIHIAFSYYSHTHTQTFFVWHSTLSYLPHLYTHTHMPPSTMYLPAIIIFSHLSLSFALTIVSPAMSIKQMIEWICCSSWGARSAQICHCHCRDIQIMGWPGHRIPGRLITTQRNNAINQLCPVLNIINIIIVIIIIVRCMKEDSLSRSSYSFNYTISVWLRLIVAIYILI